MHRRDIRFPDELWAELEALAARRHTTVSALVREACVALLEYERKKARRKSA